METVIENESFVVVNHHVLLHRSFLVVEIAVESVISCLSLLVEIVVQGGVES